MRLEFRARQRCAAPQRTRLRMSENAAIKRTASGAGAIKHGAVEFGEGLLYVGGSLSLARHACPPSVWGGMASGSELILRPGLAKALNPQRYSPCQAPRVPNADVQCATNDDGVLLEELLDAVPRELVVQIDMPKTSTIRTFTTTACAGTFCTGSR